MQGVHSLCICLRVHQKHKLGEQFEFAAETLTQDSDVLLAWVSFGCKVSAKLENQSYYTCVGKLCVTQGLSRPGSPPACGGRYRNLLWHLTQDVSLKDSTAPQGASAAKEEPKEVDNEVWVSSARHIPLSAGQESKRNGKPGPCHVVQRMFRKLRLGKGKVTEHKLSPPYELSDLWGGEVRGSFFKGRS